MRISTQNNEEPILISEKELNSPVLMKKSNFEAAELKNMNIKLIPVIINHKWMAFQLNSPVS